MQYKIYEINPDSTHLMEKLGITEEYKSRILEQSELKKLLDECFTEMGGIKRIVEIIPLITTDTQLQAYICMQLSVTYFWSEEVVVKVGRLPYIGKLDVKPEVLLFLFDYTQSKNDNIISILDAVISTVAKFNPSTNKDFLNIVFFVMFYFYYEDHLESYREKK